MVSLHEELCRVYGTGSFSKEAAILPAWVSAITGAVTGKYLHDQQWRSRQQAFMMTQAMRAELAARNEPIYEGFRSGRLTPVYGKGTYDDEMLRAMHGMGEDMAMYKEAFWGSIGKGIGKAVGGAFGKIRGAKAFPLVTKSMKTPLSAGTKMPSVKAPTVPSPGGAAASVPTPSTGAAKNVPSPAGSLLGGTQSGASVPAPNPAMKAPTPTTPSAGQLMTPPPAPSVTQPSPQGASTPSAPAATTSAQGTQTQGAQGSAPATQKQPPQQHSTAQQPTPAPLPAQPNQTGPAAQGAAPTGTNTVPAANTPQTPERGQGKPVQTPDPSALSTPNSPTATTNQAAAQGPSVSPTQTAQEGIDLKKAWKRTGLSDGRWKTKLPMLGAGALGAYGVYRLGKGTLDWLGQEPMPYIHGNPYSQPASTVNEWGQAQR